MDAADFEKVWYFTFSVERLKGMAAALAQSMAQRGARQPGAGAAGAAQASAELKADYLRLLDAIGDLQRQHAQFIAGGLRGSIAAHLAATEQVLNACSDIVGRVDYPGAGADAQSLRSTARKCLALQAAR